MRRARSGSHSVVRNRGRSGRAGLGEGGPRAGAHLIETFAFASSMGTVSSFAPFTTSKCDAGQSASLSETPNAADSPVLNARRSTSMLSPYTPCCAETLLCSSRKGSAAAAAANARRHTGDIIAKHVPGLAKFKVVQGRSDQPLGMARFDHQGGFNPIYNADPARLYGSENPRPGTAGAQCAARARNPILEPDDERHNTRRSYAPVASLESAIFEGQRRKKGLVGEDCAGLLSARRGEILYSDAPPRKAHPTGADGLAGLGSAQAFDTHRGKARPMTASAAGGRNPLLLFADHDDPIKHHVLAESLTAQLKGGLGPDLLPIDAEGDGARHARRPATALPDDAGGGGAAGAPTQMLHRFEDVNQAHGTAHLAQPSNHELEGILRYQYAGRNALERSPAPSRAAERAHYEAELRRLHEVRLADIQAREARMAAAGK